MYSCIEYEKVVEMKDAFEVKNRRKTWMSLLAKESNGRVAALFDAAIERPAFTWLRPPKIGSTLVRARTGGTGVPFHLGEMTVTRCALTLETGEIGLAYNREVVLTLIEGAKASGAAIIGIFHDKEARRRVCDREIDVSRFAPGIAA